MSSGSSGAGQGSFAADAPTAGGTGGSGLTPIADQTVLGNVAGGAALPVALTKAQLLTLLGLSSFGDKRADAIIRAQALCGPTLTVCQGTECDSLAVIGSTSSSGSGAVDCLTTDGGGVFSVRSGATAGSTGTAKMNGNPTLIKNWITTPFYTVFRGQIKTAVDAAASVLFELVPSNAGVSLLAIGLWPGLSLVNFSLRTFDAGGNLVNYSDLGVSLSIGSYVTVEVWNDLVNVYVALNGTIVKTLAVGAFAGGDPMTMQVQAANGATPVSREIWLDRMFTVVPPN